MKKVISLLGLLIFSLFLIIYYRYKVYTVIEIDGIAVTSPAITENLYNDEYNGKDNKISLSKVREYDNIYKRVDSYYIGEKKKNEIDIAYPVFSLDNSKILNVTNESLLIDEDFNTYEGYNGFFIADGSVYDRNTNKKTDDINYILLKLLDNIYVNSKNIELKTSDSRILSIKANSIVFFGRDKIKYYEFENDTFVYKEILAISLNSNINIDNNNLSYADFLDKLGIESIGKMITNKPELSKKTTIEQETTRIDEDITDNNEKEEIKPEVEFINVKSNVYSVSGELKVKSSDAKIIKNPTFTIYVNNEVYSRRTFAYASGNVNIGGLLPNTKIRIVGMFSYRNSKNKIIEKIFYDEEITTNKIDKLNEIILDTKIEEIFNNKISFSSIKINNEESDEVINGIKKVVLLLNDKEFNIPLNDSIKLKNLQSITYSTPAILESNKIYNYKFKIYDVSDNELNVKNAEGVVRTSKNKPVVKVHYERKDALSIDVNYEIDNKDEALLSDFKYVLYNRNGKIIKEEKLNSNSNNGTINFTNLNVDDLYVLNLYGSYDLEDGKGNQENILLNTTNLTTGSIEKDLYINLYSEEITSNSGVFHVSLGQNNQNIITSLVSNLSFVLQNEKGEDILDEYGNKIIKNYENPFINSQVLENFTFENLNSDTIYRIAFYADIKQDDKESIKLNVKNSSSLFADLSFFQFNTLKTVPVLNIKNEFVNDNSISYEVNVYDVDNVIENEEVTINVYESDNIDMSSKVYLETLTIKTSDNNFDYERLTFNNLSYSKYYEFEFKAAKYSEHAVCKSGRNKKTDPCIIDSKVFSTNNGITGNIELKKLTKAINSDNLFNVKNSKLWGIYGSSTSPIFETDSSKNLVTFGQKTSESAVNSFNYYLPDYDGKEVNISFNYKYKKNSIENASLYLVSGKTISTTNGVLVSSKKNTSIETSFNTKIKVVNGYISFVLKNNESGSSAIELTDIYIGLEKNGNLKYEQEEDYKNSTRVLIKDHYKSIENYYIKIYKYNKKEEIYDIYQYKDSDGNYKLANFSYDIDYKSNETDYIKDIDFDINFKKESSYKISLFIKPWGKEGADYELSSYTFNTYNEVRSINSLNDLLYLQNNTDYVVNVDLDFKDESISSVSDYIYKQTYGGTIDFQGHRIDVYTHEPKNLKKTIPYYFNTLGNSALLKNFDLHVYANGTSQIKGFSFIQSNYGKISNFKVTLEQTSTVSENYYSLVCNSQGKGSEISNFVGYLKEPMYVYASSAVISQSSHGTVKNGYIYGENIEIPQEYSSTSERGVAGIVANNNRGGVVSNVYSLVKINNTGASPVGNISSTTSADLGSTVKNSYSVSELGTGRDNRNLDPNFAKADGTTNVSNVYYWNDIHYTEDEIKNHLSKKMSLAVLGSPKFQNSVLNKDENEFIVDDFINNGYYPHIKLYDKLPRQDNIEIPSSDLKLEVTNVESYVEEDVIEENGNKVKYPLQKLRMQLYNPEDSIVTFTRVMINSLPCKIQSQKKEDEYIILTLLPEIDNPSISFKSSYYVEEVFYTSNGIDGSLKYDDYEKTFSFTLYKDIKTASDFRNIRNKLDENYRILNDIDFSKEVETYYISGFKGKLDGRNHILKNVKTEDYSLFEGTVEGDISNIRVENYVSNKGLINNFSKSEGTIDNIHIKFANITPSNTSVGTIVEVLNNGNLINSSVTNVSITAKDKILYNVGGLVGFSERSGANIENCFARNINIDLSDALGVSSIGGIAGNLDAGNIKNVYATGIIKTNFANAAGIIGSQNATVISNAYSNVDIISSQKSMAGIAAAASSSNTKVYNTLSLGDLKTSYNNLELIDLGLSRTKNSDVKFEINNNFAWEDQLFNGKVSKYTNGEILLSTEKLADENTYTEYLKFGNQFDYSALNLYEKESKKGTFLPKLNDMSGNLLPYQDDEDYNDCKDNDNVSNKVCNSLNKNKIESRNLEFEILNITRKKQDNIIETDSYTEHINYYIKVPENIGEIEIIGLDTEINSGLTIKKDDKYSASINGNVYNVLLETTFTKAYDSYNITGIRYKYKDSKEILSFDNYSYKLEISMAKIIKTIDDWKAIDNSYQNYTVVNDIDCTGGLCDEYKEKRVNRLVGQDPNNPVTIKNINSKLSIIDTVINEISSLKFENIEINNTLLNAQEKANYENKIKENFGFIRVSSANIKNVTFNDVTINAPNSNNVGIIGYNITGILKDITITGLNLSGQSYVGGLIGYAKDLVIDGYIKLGDEIISDEFSESTSTEYTCNVDGFDKTKYSTKKELILACDSEKQRLNLYNSTIKGNGTRIGGLIGYTEAFYYNWTSNANILVKNIKVLNSSKSNYTGGVIGKGHGKNITVYDVFVHNPNSSAYSVGGAVGYNRDDINAAHLYYVNVYNSAVIGGRNVGGVIGEATGTSDNLYAKNNVVIALYSYAGGIAGTMGLITKSGVINSHIELDTNRATYAGGIAGISTWSNSNKNISFVYNTTIKSPNGIMGGVFGFLSYGAVENTYSNATLVANNGVIGGVVGQTINTVNLWHNIVANTNIQGESSTIGGLIGKTDNTYKFPTLNQEKRKNIVVLNSVSYNANGTYNDVIGTGNKCEYCNLDTYVYKEDENSEQNDYYTNITISDINNSNFYTDKGFSTGYWDMSTLNENKFPKLKASYVKYQNLFSIDLPKSSDETTSNLYSTLRRTNYSMLSYKNSSNSLVAVHELPEYNVYSSGPDRFNIEFGKADGLSAFTLNDITYKIDKRVFTFSYNYKENINILLSDGINSKNIKIKPSDIAHKIGVYSKYYYYLDDGNIKGNIKNIDGNFIHIYNNKAINNEGYICNLITSECLFSKQNNFELLETTSLFEFNYNLKTIKTYYNFSEVDKEIVDKQIFVKNNNIEMISNVLDNNKTTILMDNYDGNNYLVVLGLDGVIYNLKNKINIPDTIRNKNIKYITNNVFGSETIVLIEYENGNILGFDYRTGSLLINEKGKSDETIIDYFKNKFSPIKNVSIKNDVSDIYEESTYVTKKIISNDKNNNNNSNYITVYEPLKNKYVVYNKNNITSTLSINDKLEKDASSKILYEKEEYNKTKKGFSGIKILLVILLFVMTGYVLWLKIVNKNSKREYKKI